MSLGKKLRRILLLLLPLQLLLQHEQQEPQDNLDTLHWGLLLIASAFQLPSASSSPLPCVSPSRGPWGPCLIPSLCEISQRLLNARHGPSQRAPPLGALLSSPAQEKLALVADGKERSGEYVMAQIGGFQRWMERGRFYDVNRVDQKEGGRLLLLRVLLLQQKEGPTLVGQPFLEHIRVWATVLRHFRGPKIRGGKHRPKKWRKMWGHRQALSRIRVDEIENIQETKKLKYNHEDPLYSTLMAIRRHEKPSLHLPLYKAQGLALANRAELPLIGEDPLALFDPKLNQLVADRLAVGHSDILPILGETEHS